jgi:hypothetical protein
MCPLLYSIHDEVTMLYDNASNWNRVMHSLETTRIYYSQKYQNVSDFYVKSWE